jgi:hypothetical protein
MAWCKRTALAHAFTPNFCVDTRAQFFPSHKLIFYAKTRHHVFTQMVHATLRHAIVSTNGACHHG